MNNHAQKDTGLKVAAAFHLFLFPNPDVKGQNGFTYCVTYDGSRNFHSWDIRSEKVRLNLTTYKKGATLNYSYRFITPKSDYEFVEDDFHHIFGIHFAPEFGRILANPSFGPVDSRPPESLRVITNALYFLGCLPSDFEEKFGAVTTALEKLEWGVRAKEIYELQST